MNFQKLVRVTSLLFLLFSLSIAADAQRRDDRGGGAGRWEQLGRVYVNARNDHDRILVNNREAFRALKLEIRGGTIEFQRVIVHFDSGADHELQIRDRIADGGQTRAIDLPGDQRRIRSVEFWYSREGWRSRPYVNLLGERGVAVPSDVPGPRDDTGAPGRWEQLGRVYVNGRNDHDRIIVTNRGAFRALQLGVKGGAIDFQRVIVHFDNGADHELQIADRIDDRTRSRVIDLPGDRRRIRSVEFWYSKGSWRSRPYVNLWGRR